MVGSKEDPIMQKMLRLVHKSLLHQAVVLLNDTRIGEEALIEMAPYTEGQKPIEGKATAYICENYSCQAPVTNVDDLASRLGISF